MSFLIFIGTSIAGYGLIRYSKWLADNIVHIEFADKLLGPTGTYTFWKAVGVGAIVYGIYQLFN
jgi:hypothetical protein